jgi:hypothetical protein
VLHDTLQIQRCTSSECCTSAICDLARSFDLVLLVVQIPKGQNTVSLNTDNLERFRLVAKALRAP